MVINEKVYKRVDIQTRTISRFNDVTAINTVHVCSNCASVGLEIEIQYGVVCVLWMSKGSYAISCREYICLCGSTVADGQS